MSTSRFSWLAFFCALLLLSSSAALQGQSSTPTSSKLDPITQQAQPLWQSLNEIASSLPQTYDSFMASLTLQISSLQDSNGQLDSSNKSLTLQNAALLDSLQQSQARAAMFESKSLLLQKDLGISIAYTTQVDLDIAKAQADARALEFQNGLLKAGVVTLTVVGADLAVKAFTGKDVIEWVISLVKGK